MCVDHDYGTLGIVAHTDGDESVRQYISHENRGQWRRIEETMTYEEALDIANGT